MKTIRLIVVALTFFIAGTMNAQTNMIRVSPLSFGKFKVKVHFEHTLTSHFSVGVIGDYMFGLYSGFKIEPFARFYFSEEAPGGLYLQAKYHFSGVQTNTETQTLTYTIPRGTAFSEMGGSACVGYQALFGKDKRYTFDIYTGYRFTSLGYTRDITINNALDDAKATYRLLHVNSFDLGISFGYRF